MAVACTKRNKDADDSDLYTTSRESLERFWEKAPRFLLNCKSVTDNSFGLGDITKFLKEKGKYTVGYDINNYGESFAEHNDETLYRDFLTMPVEDMTDTDCVFFNPPFTLTAEFVDKSLEKYSNCFMFNRLTTLESIKRSNKFKSGEWPLRKVWIYGGRVTCAKGTTYEKTANAVPYAMYWFDADHEGAATIDWI